jgi:hypothetical protein
MLHLLGWHHRGTENTEAQDLYHHLSALCVSVVNAFSRQAKQDYTGIQARHCRFWFPARPCYNACCSGKVLIAKMASRDKARAPENLGVLGGL